MATAERVELELGFQGGGHLRCSVARADAVELLQAFHRAPESLFALDADRGRVVVDLRRLAYVRELTRRRLGFAG